MKIGHVSRKVRCPSVEREGIHSGPEALEQRSVRNKLAVHHGVNLVSIVCVEPLQLADYHIHHV